MVALAIGCALLLVHALSASAAPIVGTTGTLLCVSAPCIGAITVQPAYTGDLGTYADFAFDTSVDASVILSLSLEAPDSAVLYSEFARVDAAAMQVIPSQAHAIRLASLHAGTMYHYALIAVADGGHKTRVVGTFTTGQSIEGDGPDRPGTPASNSPPTLR